MNILKPTNDNKRSKEIKFLSWSESSPPHVTSPDLDAPTSKSMVSPKMVTEQVLIERDALLAEKEKLERENEELADFCAQMMKEVDGGS
eukprot:CAMPEP_0178812262 /NCGR_PEP_ID=MMETSP0745-20121128/19729_1 /TAXON_ID=913974 /ORGANISM="Nitzschia punctata, Strain CCMP561" /LENGTH=88 /DNA_ID=CAMNT_0020473037 /DNA_START=76 /DNA_END=343 /DNA_ORIENTATION=+